MANKRQFLCTEFTYKVKVKVVITKPHGFILCMKVTVPQYVNLTKTHETVIKVLGESAKL
jgi:hypothetical protein